MQKKLTLALDSIQSQPGGITLKSPQELNLMREAGHVVAEDNRIQQDFLVIYGYLILAGTILLEQ